MYHQERMIDGILHYRQSPTSQWEVASIEVKDLEEVKRKLLKGIDDE